jgi:hypothetical protein
MQKAGNKERKEIVKRESKQTDEKKITQERKKGKK